MIWENGKLKYRKNNDSIYFPVFAGDLAQEAMQMCFLNGINRDFIIQGIGDQGGIDEFQDGGDSLWLWAHGNHGNVIAGAGVHYTAQDVAAQIDLILPAGFGGAVILWSCSAGSPGGMAQQVKAALPVARNNVGVMGCLFSTGTMIDEFPMMVNPNTGRPTEKTRRLHMKTY